LGAGFLGFVEQQQFYDFPIKNPGKA